jgi:hypothetical protein
MLERREFLASVFCLILTVDDAMGEPLEFRITLPDVLFKACDIVVGGFELLLNRGMIVSVLTKFG